MIRGRLAVAALTLTLTFALLGCKKQAANHASLNPQGLKLAEVGLVDDIKTVVLNPKEAALGSQEMLNLTGIDLQKTAKEYEADFDANEIAADQLYKGKRVLLSGSIETINKDIAGNGYLTLRSNSPLGAQARLSDEGMRGAAQLEKGTLVYLVCDPGTRMATIAIANNCRRFSQYLDEIRSPLRDALTEFFQGQRPLPRKVGSTLAMMYVIGSDLPPNSPCLNGSTDACEEVFKAVARDTLRAQEIEAKTKALLPILKLI